MILAIDNLLTAEELTDITSTLKPDDFVDGKTTAGWHARQVKHNSQLSQDVPYLANLKKSVRSALQRNPLFQIAVQPREIHSLLFSRYEAGMSYGTHVDNALMGGQQFWRSDVSFTIFLSDPSTYEGGALSLDSSEGDRSYKLAAGSAIVYPSSTLHQVEPVTAGVRLVVVGWVQSLVRDPAKREILFDLDAARRSLFQHHGKTPEFDLISKSHANLLRQWAE